MSGRTLVSALVLVLLAAPAAASAKGVQDAQACGPDGCVAALTEETYLVFEGGPTAGPPAERAPFYELRYRVMAGDGPEPDLVPVRVLFVPSEGLVRGEDGTWMRADDRAADALRRHLAGVAPFPAADLDLSSRQASGSSDPQPGPMDLRTPGETRSTSPGGIDTAPAVGAAVALALIAAGAAVAVGSRRRRRPAAG